MPEPGTVDAALNRKHTRLPLVLNISAEGISGVTENLSAGGLFVQTEQLFALGQTLDLTLSFPGLLDPVAVLATVAWMRAGAFDTPAGIGLRFDREILGSQPALAGLIAQAGGTSPLPWIESRQADVERAFRILVVEDSSDVALLYRHVLRRLEHAPDGAPLSLVVDFASDGWEALRLLREKPHDLLLTDLLMPVLDGFDLIAKIRAEPALNGLRVMVLSGAGPEALRRARSLGADAVVAKPMRFGDILQTARALLDLKGLEAQPRA